MIAEPPFSFPAYAAIFGALLYCSVLIRAHKQLDADASWYLAGAVFSGTVGTLMIRMWLLLNLDLSHQTGAVLEWRWNWGLTIGILQVMGLLFTAVTVHYLIYFVDAQWRHIRRGRHRTAPLLQTGFGLLAMAGVLVMAFLELYPPYAAARARIETHGDRYGEQIRRDTRAYLEAWLEAEPDSEHAKRLLEEIED